MEFAAGVEPVGEEIGHGDHRRRRRQGQGHGDGQGLVHRPARPGLVVGVHRPRQARQQGDADRHPHQALGQQIETVAHRQPGARAVDVADQELGDEHIDLADAGGEGARHGQLDQLDDLRREARQAPIHIGARAAHAPPQQARLGDPGHDHPRRGGIGRRRGRMGGQHRHQGPDVEQDRRPGRQDEAVARVQHPRQVGVDRHARQIGHGDHGQDDRQVRLARHAQKARRIDGDDPGHGQLGHEGDRQGHGQQGGHGVGGQHVGRLLAVALQGLGIGGHEGGGEGALGEDAAEQVGEGEGGGVGVGDEGGAGAHVVGDHQVAGEAHDAADQGQAGIDHRRLDHARPGGLGGRIGDGGGFGGHPRAVRWPAGGVKAPGCPQIGRRRAVQPSGAQPFWPLD